jgi:hypothetical protein
MGQPKRASNFTKNNKLVYKTKKEETHVKERLKEIVEICQKIKKNCEKCK